MSTVLDPSDPGVSKHDMAQWLYERDKTTTLHSKITRAQLATKVRKAQPHLFPNPDTDDPALDSNELPHQQQESGDRKVFGSMESHNPMPSPSTSGRNSQDLTSIATIAPPRKAKRVSFDPPISTCYLLHDVKPNLADMGPARKAKRVSSDDHSGSTMMKKKKKKSMEQQIPDHPTSNSIPKSTGKGISKSTPGVKATSLLEVQDQCEHTRELSVLQEPLVLPALNPSSNRVEDNNEGLEEQLISLGSEEGKPDTSSTHRYEMDLMEFPELDIFESENTILGRNIDPIPFKPSIEPNSELPVLSGTDYFQIQRSKEEQLATLEERVASFEDMKQIIVTTQTRLDFLEMQVERLENELQSARNDINEHNKVLTGLLSVEEGEDSGTGSSVSD
ncbi:uncharacterized protein MELLADRAFT_68479 [Melampsora larici-populina 98AG31]|uniref:Uncharacterized protein n=1 Tax=Melampsora larici-populina (strain 98AG31 / pathotype 3-4-7) TaxID=747676 RepID=F4S6Y5_MELLP|nr:uncharacterized protein MELLADRAFT_68479 [Melampsora larici-populina 98AG31]EGF99539.1 hypothetical protein MELLADRAFT_68479 [Melampsora larici-populina 98AG31]